MVYKTRAWTADRDLRLSELSYVEDSRPAKYDELLIGRPIFDYMHPEDIAVVHANMLSSSGDYRAFGGAVCRFLLGDGITIVEEISGSPIFDDAKGFVGYRGTARMIGGIALGSLEASILPLDTVYARAPMALCVIDRSGRFLAMNDRHANLLTSTVGQSLSDHHPASMEKLNDDFALLDRGEPVPDHEARIDDKIYAVLVSPLADALGNIVAVSVAHFDVTERRGLEEQLREANGRLTEMALRDHLTGVFNRRYFDISIAEEESRIARVGGELSLIMIDVDRFKLYNDTLGHLAGDQCLIAIAKAMSRELHRNADMLCRYGGEEFAVILPNTARRGAEVVAERLRRAVERLKLPHEPNVPYGHVTISVGVASRSQPNPHQDGTEALVLAADGALYEAKTSGRNRVGLAN
ncbi:hypothetical protein ANOBCDAF_01447 [Pleomorphomonas sp. T1.2MG-36]|uniref:sensor domain-containing diguanylate cyclase n=1 Tax=Pleomorphomonas sp. T1.2MG-36 TaxID=3041167 RepID=UPI002477658B|nr:diguanylate cyclase [Pleomorphomonas sp. T1.2MG-36]CAI9406467.1 hypothetical protein ANOBCDAF_01447 [Pleomorphomonas sp. T1.2MG-36]